MIGWVVPQRVLSPRGLVWVCLFGASLLFPACSSESVESDAAPAWTDLASQVTGQPAFLAFRMEVVDSALTGCLEESKSPCARVLLSMVTFPEARPELQDALHRHVVELMKLKWEPGDGALTSWWVRDDAARLAHEFLQDYRRFSSDFPDVPGEWFLHRSLEVVAASPDFLTMGMTERWYTGGAHPNGEVIFRTVDVGSGKVLGLADLLAPGFEPILREVGEIAFRKERGLEEGEDLASAGFFEANDGRFELNHNFAPTADGLAFHFDAYEIAAYAAGPTDLTIPWTELQSVIPVGGPVANFVGTPNPSPGAPQ